MPPADLIPEVVRGIITYMNITNAAVLYDETFSEYISPPFGWGKSTFRGSRPPRVVENTTFNFLG